ncbi:MAG: hypothetical protein DRH43_07395 [Deltaproteobacteria bacterium]|nr:MAG: hypothetical protein DRH43_07395 [Deltaproteobacteria bacterium]
MLSRAEISRPGSHDRPVLSGKAALHSSEPVDPSRGTGATEADFARVTVKNRRHGALNPLARVQEPVTKDTLTWAGRFP